jgi:MinD superfamily P-loop ATPase
VKFKLTYGAKNADKPILSWIILETGVAINILEGKMGPKAGELIVDVQAEGDKLQRVISLLKKEGVGVKDISRFIEIDRERCISCGACVSPCAYGAIIQNSNWDPEFIEERCVGCLICVRACPLGAIKAL